MVLMSTDALTSRVVSTLPLVAGSEIRPTSLRVSSPQSAVGERWAIKINERFYIFFSTNEQFFSLNERFTFPEMSALS